MKTVQVDSSKPRGLPATADVVRKNQKDDARTSDTRAPSIIPVLHARRPCLFAASRKNWSPAPLPAGSLRKLHPFTMAQQSVTYASLHASGQQHLGDLLQQPFRPAKPCAPINEIVIRQGRLPPQMWITLPHNGKLSCFFAGVSTCLSLSIASARAIRRRVECGMMTSSR